MNVTQTLWESIHFICFVLLVNGIQPVLELRFMGDFTDRKVKIGHYVFYILLSLAISILELMLHLAPLSLLFLIVRTTLLWGFGAVLLKTQPAISLLTAIVAETVSLLSAGIIAPLTFLTASAVVRTGTGGFMLGFLGQICLFLLIITGYRIILRKWKWQGPLPSQYLTVFFLPVLMVLLVEQYMFNHVYGNAVIIENAKIIKPLADHWQILFIQLFACFSLFSTLYACRRLTEDFSNRTRILLLERETAAQRDYLAESRTRDEQTRAFRHDINHHLLALAGLLQKGETEKTKAYLRKLQNIAATFSSPCKTGNTVVDTVLGSKLSVARQSGIHVECLVNIPSPCMVDDLDFCVLFANAMDNAIHACNKQEEETRFIRLASKHKGDFLMIEMENSCLPQGTYQKGIGLTNIEAVAEKYQGAVTTEKQGACFQLHVLLVLSRHLENSSVKPS